METKRKYIYGTGVIIVSLLLSVWIERITLPVTTPAMTAAATQYVATTHKPSPPRTFSQDGCSLFFDSILGHDFTAACLTHDIHYWAGGSKEERKTADLALRAEIAHTGILGPIFAPVVYLGVRWFGDSWLTRAVDANWGYGWND